MRSHADVAITGMSVAVVIDASPQRSYAKESGKQLATIDVVMTYEVLHYFLLTVNFNVNKPDMFVKHRTPRR